MDTQHLLKEVKNEIERLQKVVQLLEGNQPSSTRKGKGKGTRPPMSQAARDKIAAAQRKRWREEKKKKAAKAA